MKSSILRKCFNIIVKIKKIETKIENNTISDHNLLFFE